MTPLFPQKTLLQQKPSVLQQLQFPVLKKTFCSALPYRNRRSLGIPKVVLVSLTFPGLCENRNKFLKRHRKAFLIVNRDILNVTKTPSFLGNLIFTAITQHWNLSITKPDFSMFQMMFKPMEVELCSVMILTPKVSENRSIWIVGHTQICDFPHPVQDFHDLEKQQWLKSRLNCGFHESSMLITTGFQANSSGISGSVEMH